MDDRRERHGRERGRHGQREERTEAVTICELCCPDDTPSHHHEHHVHHSNSNTTRSDVYVHQQPLQTYEREPRRRDQPTNIEMSTLSSHHLPTYPHGETMDTRREREPNRDLEAQTSATRRPLIAQGSSLAPTQINSATQLTNTALEGPALALADSSPAATIALRIGQIGANIGGLFASGVDIKTRVTNGAQLALALGLLGFTIAFYVGNIDCSNADQGQSAQCKAYNILDWTHTALTFFGSAVPMAYHAANPAPSPTLTR